MCGAPRTRGDADDASLGQPRRVPGLDEAHAERVVGRRPYMTKRDLVTRGALAPDEYDVAAAHLLLGPPAMPEYPYSVPPLTWPPR